MALAGAVVLLELWHADLHVPFAYDHDALQNLLIIKNTLTQGWPLTNPDLGAPFGSQLYDFPVVAGDALHLTLMHVLGLLSRDPAFVANTFFILTFPLTAFIACFVLVNLRVSRGAAIALAVLYALAPYHFFRGENHLFLQAYFALPLGIYLAVLTATGERLRTRHGLVALGVMCLLVATTDVYFAVFTILLLLIGIGLAALSPQRRPAVPQAAVALGVVVALVLIQHLPAIVYHARHGSNQAVAALRSPAQSETFGMKVVRMVLPVDGHRLGPFASATRTYVRESPAQLTESSSQSLGLAAVVGLLFLLGLGLTRIIGSTRAREEAVESYLPAASALTVATMLLALAGGFSLVISYLGTDAIRSWDRMSIVLAFLALFALGVLLDRLRPRLGRAWMWPALLVALVVLATLDQVPASVVPDYGKLARTWKQDKTYFTAIDDELPHGSQIYNAPYVPFPERGYDEARGYIHSPHLRWSYGAVEGRPADWARGLSGQRGDVIVPAVAAAGMRGVLVDTGLYPDGGRAADSDLRRITGSPALASRDGSFRYYDLNAYRQALRRTIGASDLSQLQRLVLHPVRVDYGDEFSSPLFEGGEPLSVASIRYTDRPSGHLTLVNPLPQPRRVRFSALLVDEQGGGSNAAVRWPDGKVERLKLDESGSNLDRELVLPSGSSSIAIASDRPLKESVKQYLTLRNVAVTEDRVSQIAARAPVLGGS